MSFTLNSFRKFSRVAAAFIFLVCAPESFAEVKIPTLTSPVIDDAGMFSSSERNELVALLRSKLSTAQFQIWTIGSLEGDAIENVSIRAVEAWKLGSEKQDNGLLILISKNDRRMRIEVGQGLEGSIPDVIAGRVVDQIMKPYFREGQFFEGTIQAAQFLYQRLENPNTGTRNDLSQPRRKRGGLGDLPLAILVLLLIIIIKFISFIDRIRHPFRRNRRGWFDGGFGGGGGGWSSGGGGWSGGGGGFSGGGSSGSW